jgi:hypothetical protein
MRSLVSFLAIVTVCGLFPTIMTAQDLPRGISGGIRAQPSPVGSGFVSSPASISGLGFLNFADVPISATVGIGLQKIGVNFNLPGSWSQTWADAFSITGPGTFDVKIADSSMWIGALCVDVRLSPTISLFFRGEANAPKNILVTTSQDPLAGFAWVTETLQTAADPIKWTGSRLEVWSIDGGLIYRLRSDVALIGGLRRQHLSLRLDDPTDAQGHPINWAWLEPGLFRYGFAGGADFLAKMWLPYVGVMIEGSNYRGSILWSPLASVRVTAPIRFGLQLTDALGRIENDFQWHYESFNPGLFFEFDFESDTEINSRALLRLWARARWLNVRGGGSLEYSVREVGVAIPTEGTEGIAGTATYSEYSVAGGASTLISF